MIKTRTAGDGMECDENVKELPSKSDFTSKCRSTSKGSLLPARLIQLYPTHIFKSNRSNAPISAKTPKFVPYEPYKGAVKPIVPASITKGAKKSRNNMDINTLIRQMSQMDTNLNEFKPRSKLTSISDKSGIEPQKPNFEIEEQQKKITELMIENDSLKEQLKQQVQVNKELKTMLVASMGEDLETQVQSLNEDKKHLANALLNSSQHLSTHQEQTEWLAGQCEVWRSKFLASSLMVEELANWKKILNEKTENLQQAIKTLLEERCRTRDMMVCTYKNLYSLHEKWLEDIAISEYVGNTRVYNQPIGNINLSATVPPSTNILDLSLVNLKLSENLTSSVQKQDVSHLNNLPTITDGEQYAENVMATPLNVNKVQEEPVNALVHHAYSKSGNTVRPIASCVHCNDAVETQPFARGPRRVLTSDKSEWSSGLEPRCCQTSNTYRYRYIVVVSIYLCVNLPRSPLPTEFVPFEKNQTFAAVNVFYIDFMYSAARIRKTNAIHFKEINSKPNYPILAHMLFLSIILHLTWAGLAKELGLAMQLISQWFLNRSRDAFKKCT